MQRRTQKERREATVAKLLQATIDAIAEVGYSRASIKEICDRAGVSHGGLFRHFPTREDLVVAAAQEVARRQLATARDRLGSVELRGEAGLVTGLKVIREGSRSPMNAVFHEVLIACRTDEALAAKFRPAALEYYAQIYSLASELFGIESDPDRLFETLLFSALVLFDGETIARSLFVDADLEERRLRWLAEAGEATLRSPAD